MKALILAAGLGTRLKPITDSLPKALATVGSTTLLEYNLKRLSAQGVTEFIVNVHYKADMVEDFLRQHKNFGLSVAISDERKLLLDTGGGLKHAAWFFDDGKPFLIYNVDVITSLDVRKVYAQHVQIGALATLAVSCRSATRYFLFGAGRRLYGWRNAKTGEERRPVASTENLIPLAFGGVHVVSPEIFPHLDAFGDKFSIVDAYLALAPKYPIVGYDMQEEQWLDAGTPEMLKAASALVAAGAAPSGAL
ncbi:MAG: NTP transferase domain-containing protein [Prevotellaceae bacterium]|jgi:NDP-sugar pyrophosphorylase family protein|nr:NTP transferase domain-containing protein [Prevotellaceae bacterium]